MIYSSAKFDFWEERFLDKMDDSNIKAVTSLLDQKPKTVGDVRKILGLLSYYRRSIPAFANIAKPSYELLTGTDNIAQPSEVNNSKGQLKSNVYVKWTDRHNGSLEEPGGGGVHDLRMDGGLPPGFQKGTSF